MNNVSSYRLNSYKKDIDGLRAVAILCVLFFHVGFSLFPGGYVGVDVFFVISGYLITGILYKAIAEAHFSFITFYLRRIRRLAPSMIIVIIFCWLMGFFILDETLFFELGKTLISSTFFVSNWYFFTKMGYFDSALALNPLLHTWSLSVEEQFYLFWPVIMLIIFGFTALSYRRKIGILISFTVFSLCASVFLVDIHSNDNVFFNTFSRIGELSLGASLAVLAVHWNVSVRQASCFRVLGFICIGISVYLFNDTMKFPGVGSFLPILGAALMIVASNCAAGIGYGVLSCKPVSYIGKISYSLYLWHWPLIVYSSFFWPSRTVYQSWFILFLSFVFASLTTYFVENPIRFKRAITSGRKFVFVVLLLTLFVLALSLLTVTSKGMPQRWKYENINLHSANYDFKDAFDVGGCFIENQHTADDLVAHGCLIPQDDKINLLLIGDSFAAQLMPGLKKYFPEIHINQATASACRGLLDVADPTQNWGDWPCPDLNTLLFHDVIKRPGYDIVMLVSDWQYWKGPIDGIALLKTVEHIHKYSQSEVIVIGNSPVYKSATDASFRAHTFTNKALFNKLEFRDHLMDVELFNQKNIAQGEFISILDNYCHNDVCPIVSPEGNLIHFGDHLTEWGAIEVINSVEQDIQDVINRAKEKRP